MPQGDDGNAAIATCALPDTKADVSELIAAVDHRTVVSVGKELKTIAASYQGYSS